MARVIFDGIVINLLPSAQGLNPNVRFSCICRPSLHRADHTETYKWALPRHGPSNDSCLTMRFLPIRELGPAQTRGGRRDELVLKGAKRNVRGRPLTKHDQAVDGGVSGGSSKISDSRGPSTSSKSSSLISALISVIALW